MKTECLLMSVLVFVLCLLVGTQLSPYRSLDIGQNEIQVF